jgi:long-chain acyl-CoA synthetase
MGKANFEIINDPSITAADFQSVRVNLTGGDKITQALLKNFKEKTHVTLRQGYGMSEVLCITVNKSSAPHKLGSIGTPTKELSIFLVDKNQQPVSEGQVGEVLVSGPNVMLNYWHDIALTQKTIVNGMLHTGDLAYKDEDGYYWFYGRLKQLIVREGNNISPLEIEEVLMQHEAVKLVGVTGKADAQEGAVPIAFVVLKNKNVDADALLTFAASRLEDFKIPAAIYIVNHLPLTASNKIDRNRLQALIP